MLRRILPFILCLAASLPMPAAAQVPLPSDPVMDAIRIDDILDILSAESAVQGRDLDQTMMQGDGGAGWARVVAAIHDPGPWASRLRTTVNDNLPERYLEPILNFMTSDQGVRIVELEISARRAMLDATIEDASRARLAQLEAEDAPILDQITRFIDANDLIESNVVGALNANVAFFEGLQDGVDGPPQGDYLSDVWSQEPEIRKSTRDWLYAFLSMAYTPLSDGDMEAYIAFSESPAGQAFNTAVFAAFDQMFIETSRATGLALGRMMSAEDI